MGWRFRRTLSMGGFRWTASKSGVGGSWGLGGIFRFGVSPDGRHFMSVRVPGTGVSWVKYYTRRIARPIAGGPSAPAVPSVSTSSQHTTSQGANQPTPVSQPWWSQPWWKQKGP
jgi:hypothetical protein